MLLGFDLFNFDFYFVIEEKLEKRADVCAMNARARFTFQFLRSFNHHISSLIDLPYLRAIFVIDRVLFFSFSWRDRLVVQVTRTIDSV